MPCRCSTRACWPNICTAGRRRRCSTSRTWARRRSPVPTAAAALERLVPGDMLGLKPGRQRYTLLTNEAGGILDDLMVANLGQERLFLVVNASRKDVDFTHIAANLPSGVLLQPHEDRALLALQGPAAAAVIGRLATGCGATAVHGRGRLSRSRALPAWSHAPATPARTGSRFRSPPISAEVVAAAHPGPARGRPGRSGRTRFAATGGGSLPLRQRYRRTDHADRGRASPGRSASAAAPTWDFLGCHGDPRPARARHGAPSRRHPSRRPRARPRADRDRRRGRHRGGHDHLRRLLALAERADRHGLCPQGPRRRRHRSCT